MKHKRDIIEQSLRMLVDRLGKTYLFKRCLFLKNIRQKEIVQLLVAALGTCPTPLCYVHLLHGGGAVRDIKAAERLVFR
ncbi:hypothetical protein BJX68DRAFT_235098 [Aspergillus pseudodeflectus]|uniref:Uncharacterized protein n=1 Tax=Aspergillus pseudodeflectus TaxID=176178 RepID=A0ABR4KJN9_9EURO